MTEGIDWRARAERAWRETIECARDGHWGCPGPTSHIESALREAALSNPVSSPGAGGQESLSEQLFAERAKVSALTTELEAARTAIEYEPPSDPLEIAKRLRLIVENHNKQCGDFVTQRNSAWRRAIDLGKAKTAAEAKLAALESRDPPGRAIRVGVAVLVKDGAGRLLLGRRAKDPNRGKWVIPGGGIKPGEGWQAAGEREVKEETGLTVAIVGAPDYVLEIIGEHEHRVILCVQVEGDRWASVPGSDLSEAMFFEPDSLPWADISPAVAPALTAFGYFAAAPAQLPEAGGEAEKAEVLSGLAATPSERARGCDCGHCLPRCLSAARAEAFEEAARLADLDAAFYDPLLFETASQQERNVAAFALGLLTALARDIRALAATSAPESIPVAAGRAVEVVAPPLNPKVP